MSECPRVGKFFGGCRFEGRWSIGAPTITAAQLRELVWSDDKSEGFKLSRPRTYVHDVCLRCGKIIHRTPNPTPANGEAEA